MRTLMISLALGVSLAGTGGAWAQQAVTVDGVQATQVVIAPPNSPVAQDLKAKLNQAYYGGSASGPSFGNAQTLYYFYGARHFDPIWVQTAADGSVSLSPAAAKIETVFKNAASEGFKPEDYLTPDLDTAAVGTDPARIAALEMAFSTAALKYAHDAYLGRVAPQAVSGDIDPESKQLDTADILNKLAFSDAPDQILASLDPTDPEFAALKSALVKVDGVKTEAQVVIPPGRTLKPGARDPRVALLRKRLNIAEPYDDPDRYNSALTDAVIAFQAGAGQNADGYVGPGTLAALNGNAAPKISRDDIIANMERWRWLPHDLGAFHVMVNIPEFRVAVVQDNAPIYTTRVVVGKPDTPTPIFSNSIKNIVVNPYWNVPASIVAKEIAPHMLANPGYIAGQNMQIVNGSRVIDPNAIDWAGVTQANWHYNVRQLPGGANALGQIKFLFPNDHDVYLHDTPSKSLFGTAVRAYSHGCVRVQNPMDFADALLKAEPNLNVDMLESMFGNTERWVNLKTHVPVHIAYFTVRADADGTLHSYRDVYGHNKRLVDLLNGRAAPAAPVTAPRISGV